MANEQHLDYAFQLLDDFLNDVSKIPLQERININDYGTASIIVDDKITNLTVDAKKTVSLAKNLYKQITNTKRQAVTERFLKYFRLISENTKKVSVTMSGLISDTSWMQKVPKNIIMKGVKAIEFFRKSINEVLEDLNAKIFIPGDKIKLIPPIKWKVINADENERHRQQMRIKMRNYKLFESVYEKSMHQF